MPRLEFPYTELPTFKTEAGHDISMSKLLRFDAGNLLDEFEHHAAWQALVSFQHTSVSGKVLRKKREIKSKEGEKHLYWKENFEKVYGYKPVADSISAAVNNDPAILKLYDELHDLMDREMILDSARFSLLAKKDMLVSLGAEQRSERRIGAAQ